MKLKMTLVQICLRETMKFKLSTTVAIYSLCYSIMKSCAYWTYYLLLSIMAKDYVIVYL